MANFSAKILNNSVSALSAQQAAIATTSTNIANVNTPGYARRSVELQTRGSSGGGTGPAVGNGVEVTDITRSIDKYLETLLQQSTGNKSRDELKNDILTRVEELFNLTGDQPTIGSTISDFFAAVNDLSVSPSSLDLRSNVIQRGQDLVSAINSTYNAIAGIQTELDTRLTSEISVINDLTQQIAELNQRVGQRESVGEVAADERDQRDVLVNKLADKIGFQVLDVENGMINITLPNGFPLVNGVSSRDLSLTDSPSFAAGNLPPSLGGGVLRYVVYDFDPGAGSSHIDLTQMIQGGSGTLAAILQLRGYNDANNTSAFQADGDLVAIASRIEAITRNLLTSLNEMYRGPDESPTLTPAFVDGSAGDLNGNVPGVFGLFDFIYNGAVAKDANNNGIANMSDITNAALGIDNFSSILTFAVATPESFAAARDNDPAEGATSFPQGDASNAQALVTLRTALIPFSVGSFTLNSTTFEDAYNEIVTFVGNAKASASIAAKVSADSLIAASNRRDQISAVSLDEEFADLIKHQKAYQASARMIRVAQDLLDQLFNVI